MDTSSSSSFATASTIATQSNFISPFHFGGLEGLNLGTNLAKYTISFNLAKCITGYNYLVYKAQQCLCSSYKTGSHISNLYKIIEYNNQFHNIKTFGGG